MSLLTQLHDFTEQQRKVRQSNGAQLFSPLFNALPSPVRQVASKWLNKSEEERLALTHSDLTLLATLRDQGHLSVLPALRDVNHSDTKNSSSFHPMAGEAGFVTIQSDFEGKPVEFSTVSTPTLARWFVLLHEVAHQEFELLNKPFQPSEDRGLSPELVDTLNQWSFGPLKRSYRARAVLNECFADTYSSMLMLSSLEGDALELAKAQLRSIHGKRRSDTREMARDYIGAIEDTGALCHIFAPHMTEHALDRVLASADQWKGLSSTQLRQAAQEIASDGFLDAFGMDKVDPQTKFPLGWAYRWGALPEDPMSTLMGGAMNLARAYLRGVNLHLVMDDMKASSPDALAVLRETLGEMKTSLEKHFPGVREKSVFNGAQSLDPVALGAWVNDFSRDFRKIMLDNITASIALENFNQGQFQARSRIFQEFIEKPTQDWGSSQMPAVGAASLRHERQQLGLEAQMPSVSSWRQSRAPEPVPELLDAPSFRRKPSLAR